jgi:phosphoribosylformylglycinamidine synthase
MTLAVKPEHEERFMELSQKHDVESTVIGTYTDSGKIHLLYNGDTCAYVNTELLKSDFPQWEFAAEWIAPEARGLREPVLKEPEDHERFLKDMLSAPNVAGKEWIIRQYDHEVQGGSVIKPLVGKERDVTSDAAVIRPILTSQRGLATTQACNPLYSAIDAYHMVGCTIDEAVRRLIAVGASMDHIGGVDNFCWPNIQYDPASNPDGKLKAAQLVRANWALRDYCLAFDIPLLSGKDSMYIDGNLKGAYGETHKVSGLPTLQFAATSIVPDTQKCVTMDAKIPGDLVYILGITRNELGGSEYYDQFGYIGLNVPKVRHEEVIPLYKALSKAIEAETVASAHGVYRGGLGVHLSLVAMAGCLGMDIDVSKIPREDVDANDQILYSESTGRFIVTIGPEQREAFGAMFQGCPCAEIGKVTEETNLTIRGIEGNVLLNSAIAGLKQAWKGTFGNLT